MGTPTTSPFDQEIALGFYDGPTHGFLHCRDCQQEFYFAMIDSRAVSSEEDTRIFELASIPIGSIARFETAMSPFQQTIHPVWVPLWSFPTDQDRDWMSQFVDGIVSQKGPVEWVVASSTWLSDEILAARPIENLDRQEPVDWFTSLGLIPASIED